MEVGQLQPVQTVREYSFMSNPRTPAAVKGGVRKLGPITASTSLDELARYKDKVPEPEPEPEPEPDPEPHPNPRPRPNS